MMFLPDFLDQTGIYSKPDFNGFISNNSPGE